MKEIRDKVFSKDFFVKTIYILGLMFLFYIFEVYLRYIAITIDPFYPGKGLIPNFLTIVFICYFFPLFFIKSKKGSRITLILFYVIDLIYFIVNYMMLKIKSIPLDFYNLNNVSEGLAYVNTIYEHINIIFVIFIIITLVILIFLLWLRGKFNFEYRKRFYLLYPIVYILLIVGNIVAINSLYLEEDDWQNITSPRYYYDNFVNSKRSAEVVGFYHYSVRDAYLYLKENYMTTYTIDDVENLMNSFEVSEEINNEYTGIFEGKNLIMIMMESIDNVIVDKNTMPTLYKMRKDGWDFTQRYSSLIGGGSTIGTEFTSMTGLMYNNAYYRINNNIYTESIPSLFSQNGYTTISAHENNGVYYNRSELHRNMGFNNSYFLYDMLNPYEFYVDAQMATNDQVYDWIVPKNISNPFMTFIITIAAHGPYTNNSICDENEQARKNEISCFRYLAKRTDDLLSALLKRLEEDKILDDTVIVMYTDHQAYLYDYTESDLKKFNKVDENYNIKQLPFVIYSTDIKAKKIDTLVNDVDIVPTIFNLFGISYNSRNYVGTDLFSSNHEDLIMFYGGSWYDGKNYSLDENIDTKNDYFKVTSQKVNDKMLLNNMIINTNYYAKKNNE